MTIRGRDSMTAMASLVRGLSLLALLLLLLVSPGAAIAQEEDILGIYFYEPGMLNEASVQVGQMITAYLCILNSSQPLGVAGWECAIEMTEGFQVINWDIGDGINILTPPQFSVGLPMPIYWSDVIVLMEMTVWAPVEGDCELYLHPTDNPTVPGTMVYAVGYISGLLVPLNWPTGGEEFPVATLHSTPLPPVCSIEPQVVDMGPVMIGLEAQATITISNIGGGVLSGNVPSACPPFEITEGAGDFFIPASASQSVTVRFAPEQLGEVECLLAITGPCGDVTLRGTGMAPGPGCQLVPPALSFGEVAPGNEVSGSFTITNVGLETLTGEITENCSAFTVTAGAGPFALEPGASSDVTVAFAPPSPGPYSCLIGTGTFYCDGVPCSGVGILMEPECTVVPSELDFGEVDAGETAERSFTIVNIGSGELAGLVSENCDAYAILSGEGPFILDPGGEMSVTVAFTPPAEGVYACAVDIGASECAQVPCQGASGIPLEDYNVFGLFFDPEGTIDAVDVSIGPPLPAYLCLLNSTIPSGVSGWECSISWNQDFPILAWNLQGYALNVATPPDFIVGLGSPLPWQPTIVLMDLLVGRFQAGTCDFYLHPASTPSVPGHMVYATGSDPGVLIMANWPAREDSAVATMNVYTSQAECSLDPTDIDFGSLDLGEETLRQLTITNTGSDLLAGDVPASCGVFEIVAGSGPFSLAGGQSHEVTIRFAPEQEGLFSCQLDLGNGICSLVPINGIGHQEPVGTAADPPDARAVAGGVLLHWHYSQGTFDGFLVYRRPAGESARRLTEQPLAGWNGEMEYLDATDGIAPGTLVFYSYGMVRAGQEIGRSGEVSARTNGVPPASMALHPVFPNPFNPVTHISFDLEGPGPVRLEIYDVSGQRIRVLLDEPLPGGSHARQWDGRDNEGRRVPSGAYYCRLTSGRLTAFQKMLLIK